MEKQLLIMRHAKSSWSDEDATDHERKLNKRGLRDAPRMGQFIAARGCAPDLVAASTATRAKMTAELFIENCDPTHIDQLDLVDDFYHASPVVYLDYLTRLSDQQFDCVMLVGHNPGLQELVFVLSGHYETMPTAAIAHFFVTSGRWSDVAKKTSVKLSDIWRPKEIDLES